MSDPLAMILALFGLGALYVLVPVMVDAYIRFRRPREVVCPETGERVEITLDPVQAGLTAIVGEPDLQVCGCPLWPERARCAQACTAEIDPASAPRRAA